MGGCIGCAWHCGAVSYGCHTRDDMRKLHASFASGFYCEPADPASGTLKEACAGECAKWDDVGPPDVRHVSGMSAHYVVPTKWA